MSGPRSGTTLFLLGGLAVCIGLGTWAALNAAAVEDLRVRIPRQRKNLDEIENVYRDIIRLRQKVRPAQAAGVENVKLLEQMAGKEGITGAKLKAINNLPRTVRSPWIEMGYVVELADLSRESLAKFLVSVEIARPALRTKEIHIRKFTPEGEISGATVHIVYYEKEQKEPKPGG